MKTDKRFVLRFAKQGAIVAFGLLISSANLLASAQPPPILPWWWRCCDWWLVGSLMLNPFH